METKKQAERIKKTEVNSLIVYRQLGAQNKIFIIKVFRRQRKTLY